MLKQLHCYHLLGECALAFLISVLSAFHCVGSNSISYNTWGSYRLIIARWGSHACGVPIIVFIPLRSAVYSVSPRVCPYSGQAYYLLLTTQLFIPSKRTLLIFRLLYRLLLKQCLLVRLLRTVGTNSISPSINGLSFATIPFTLTEHAL